MPKIIIASGPVIVEEGRVLLDQHGDTDFWKFCGGRLDDLEESLEEGARKRAKEELGVDLEILDPAPFITYTQKETPEGVLDIILVHFLAKRIGEIVPGAEIRKWDWLPLETIEQEDLAPNILPVLKHFGFLK
ncbi:MAG: NUDIX hydrolase [Patescibacteria group bacterium]